VLCCHQGIGFPLTAQGQPLEDTMLESVGLDEADFHDVRENLEEMVAAAEDLFN